MFLNKILSKFFIAAKAFSFAIAEAGVEGSWEKKDERQQVLVGTGVSIYIYMHMYVFSSGLSNDRMP